MFKQKIGRFTVEQSGQSCRKDHLSDPAELDISHIYGSSSESSKSAEDEVIFIPILTPVDSMDEDLNSAEGMSLDRTPNLIQALSAQQREYTFSPFQFPLNHPLLSNSSSRVFEADMPDAQTHLKETVANQPPQGAIENNSVQSQQGTGSAPTLQLMTSPKRDPRLEDAGVIKVRLLGRGTYGEVFLACQNQHPNQMVALKVFKYASHFKVEDKFLSMLKHPNIICRFDKVYDRNRRHYSLTLEYAPYGDLHQYLMKKQNPFDWDKQGRAWALSAAKGLDYMHQHGIIHLDLKTDNMLIFSPNTIKLADFGLSVKADQVRKHKGNLHGTICYAAPEALVYHSPELKSDIYSFGFCLWEMQARMRPFKVTFKDGAQFMEFPDNQVTEKMMQRYQADKPIRITSKAPPKYASIMKQCWIFDTSKRISSNRLIAEIENDLPTQLPSSTKS